MARSVLMVRAGRHAAAPACDRTPWATAEASRPGKRWGRSCTRARTESLVVLQHLRDRLHPPRVQIACHYCGAVPEVNAVQDRNQVAAGDLARAKGLHMCCALSLAPHSPGATWPRRQVLPPPAVSCHLAAAAGDESGRYMCLSTVSKRCMLSLSTCKGALQQRQAPPKGPKGTREERRHVGQAPPCGRLPMRMGPAARPARDRSGYPPMAASRRGQGPPRRHGGGPGDTRGAQARGPGATLRAPAHAHGPGGTASKGSQWLPPDGGKPAGAGPAPPPWRGAGRTVCGAGTCSRRRAGRGTAGAPAAEGERGTPEVRGRGACGNVRTAPKGAPTRR